LNVTDRWTAPEEEEENEEEEEEESSTAGDTQRRVDKLSFHVLLLPSPPPNKEWRL
jgi:CO dehydrogenase/acetyl-CoA synthase beta subunit